MSAAWVWAVQLADQSIWAHKCLVLKGVHPFVTREEDSLILRRSADGPCSSVDKRPASAERGAFAMYSLKKNHTTYVSTSVEYTVQWGLLMKFLVATLPHSG